MCKSAYTTTLPANMQAAARSAQTADRLVPSCSTFRLQNSLTAGAELLGTLACNMLGLPAPEQSLHPEGVGSLPQASTLLLHVVQVLQAELAAHPCPEHLHRAKVGRSRGHCPQVHMLRCIGSHTSFVSEEALVVAEHCPGATAALRIDLSNGIREPSITHSCGPFLMISLFLCMPQHRLEPICRDTTPQ